ncbi:MAG: hypothetical protein V4692_14530 [Bdellovibrionota bacterium]
MKRYILALAFVLPSLAQAKSVSGVRAENLISIAESAGIVDYAMGGKAMFEMNNIVCQKIVTEEKGSFGCAFRSDITGERKTYRLEGESAEKLRDALREIVGEVKVGSSLKLMTLENVSCRTSGRGHELDAIDLERVSTCKIK